MLGAQGKCAQEGHVAVPSRTSFFSIKKPSDVNISNDFYGTNNAKGRSSPLFLGDFLNSNDTSTRIWWMKQYKGTPHAKKNVSFRTLPLPPGSSPNARKKTFFFQEVFPLKGNQTSSMKGIKAWCSSFFYRQMQILYCINTLILVQAYKCSNVFGLYSGGTTAYELMRWCLEFHKVIEQTKPFSMLLPPKLNVYLYYSLNQTKPNQQIEGSTDHSP